MPTHARRSFSLQALRKLGPALRSSRRELSDGTLCAFQLPRGPSFTCLGLVRGRRRPESSPGRSAVDSVARSEKYIWVERGKLTPQRRLSSLEVGEVIPQVIRHDAIRVGWYV